MQDVFQVLDLYFISAIIVEEHGENALNIKGTLCLLIKIHPDATVCRYLFIAKSLYMFRVSQHPSSGVLKTVTAASGTGHNISTATYLQRDQI